MAKVILEVLEYTDDIIVVDDGSTDSTPQILESFKNKIHVLQHPKNMGKGKALHTAFLHARDLSYEYAISIDSDGQHFTSDLPLFLSEIKENPNTLVIGARDLNQENIPSKSSIGNRFSNFCFWTETGIKLRDTQSGYRLYPIAKMEGIKLFTSKYEFEIEVIVKSVWKGVKIKNIPINIYYDNVDRRITHFKPFKDTLRIGILNIYLLTLAIIYHHPLKFIKSINSSSMKYFMR